MEIQAPNLDYLPSQSMENRNFLHFNQGNMNSYNPSIDYGLNFDGSIHNLELPFYQPNTCEPASAKTSMNRAESGVTYNIPVSRKRARDSMNEFESSDLSGKRRHCSGLASYLDQDVMSQIQQQQIGIDIFVNQHTERVRMELEEERKRTSRMLIQSIKTIVKKKLIEKNVEIQRIDKQNMLLQQKLQNIYMENQMWKDAAHTTEATVNCLRSNLEQVLASENRHQNTYTVAANDAESSTGSNEEQVLEKENVVRCRKCKVKESSVLILPCRHLCLCTKCGQGGITTCPVCNSVMNASLHVNMA